MICCAAKKPKSRGLLNFDDQKYLNKRKEYVVEQEREDKLSYEKLGIPYVVKSRFNSGQIIQMSKTYLSFTVEHKYLRKKDFEKRFALLGNQSSRELVGRVYDVLLLRQNKSNLSHKLVRSGLTLNTFLDYFEIIQVGRRIHKLILSFDILDGADGNGIIGWNNFYGLTRVLCKINAFLTGQVFSITQVKSIVQFLIDDMDQDSDNRISFMEFYTYYMDVEEGDEFFELLYGKGIESQVKKQIVSEKDKKNRRDLIAIYENLMIYLQYYKDNLVGPYDPDKKYPLIKRQYYASKVQDKQLEQYNKFQANYSTLLIKALRKKMGGKFRKKGRRFSSIVNRKVADNKKNTTGTVSRMDSRSSNRSLLTRKPLGDKNPNLPKPDDSSNLSTENLLQRTGSLLTEYVQKKEINREEAENYFIIMMDNSLMMFKKLIKKIIEEDEDDGFELQHKSTLNQDLIHRNRVKNKERGENDGLVFVFNNSWDLVISIMVGMSKSVRSLTPKELNGDIEDSYKYSINSFQFQLPNNSDIKKTCTFEDYAPNLFLSIRTACKIDSNTYLKSIGPDKLMTSLLGGDLTTLSELVSPGKSGSFLYFTYDGNYILKSIMKKEFFFFKKVLVRYFKHIMKNPESLIARYFGLQRLTIDKEGEKEVYYLVVMRNIFKTTKKLHYRFDLKGSTYKRITDIEGMSPDEISRKTLKDLNFRDMKKEHKVDVTMSPRMHKKLMENLKKDSDFLASIQVIDYSLLVGVHNEKQGSMNTHDDLTPLKEERDGYQTLQKLEIIEEKIDSEGCIARSTGGAKRIYFMGIIDTFIEFVFKKKLEYVSRSCLQGSGVSCIPPQPYANRFYQFFEASFDKQ